MVPVISRLIDHYKTPQMILSELQSIGSINLSTTNTNPNPFIHLLRIFSRAGNHIMIIGTCQHMIEFHGFVIDKETFASNLLMESLFKTSQPRHAIYVFEQTKYPNFLTFNIALYHLSNINDIVNVSYVLRHMLSLHYCPNYNTFSAVLDSFCRMNAFRQVYQILGLMVGLGIELSINVWTVLINKFCKLRRLDVATNLFYKMIRTGCSPNVFTYTALIKAFIESNMVNDALHLLNNMLSDGLEPDLVLHNVLIDCFSKAGMYGDAFLAFGGLGKQKQINKKPDLYAYTSLLPTIWRSERFDLLPKIVQDCRHIGRDLVFYNALISSCVKAGHPDLAVAFYKCMIDEGFKPDKYSFAGLLSALCVVRRIDTAVNVYRGVVEKADAHIHTVITNGLIQAGQYHRAAVLFRSAADKTYPLDSVAYAVGIHAHLRGGRTLEANALFDQMKDNGLEPNVQTFNMMFSSWLKVKDLQIVKQLLKEMIDSRTDLSDRNFFNLRNRNFFKDRCCLNLLAEMRELGLLSTKVLPMTGMLKV
jgi:pentatricopeptide repeat protein